MLELLTDGMHAPVEPLDEPELAPLLLLDVPLEPDDALAEPELDAPLLPVVPLEVDELVELPCVDVAGAHAASPQTRNAAQRMPNHRRGKPSSFDGFLASG